MKKALLGALTAAALAAFMLVPPLTRSASATPQANKPAAQKKAPEPMKLKVGEMAPDFTLLYNDGTKLQKVSLHDYRGKKNVALAFYVLAFTGG